MLHTVFRVAALTCLVIGQVFGSGEDLNSLNPDNVPSAFPRYKDFAGSPYSVTYNERAILLNDSPALFISGSIHPPRITPKSLPRVLDLAKKHGMNMLEVRSVHFSGYVYWIQPSPTQFADALAVAIVPQIYTFWNYHQPTEDTWNWEGQANLTEFIQTLGDHGFFVTLRIGPYGMGPCTLSSFLPFLCLTIILCTAALLLRLLFSLRGMDLWWGSSVDWPKGRREVSMQQ